MNLKNKLNNIGVSPVIGVILMVAVTVALVALVGVIVFDIGGDVSESPEATVQFANDNGQVKATVLRNSNVDTLRLQYEDGTTKTIGSTSGTTQTMEEGSGQYQVIAVMDDGSEQVLQSKEFESVNTGTTLEGTVSINPPIEGATVKALDTSGNVLATDTTDSEGKYSFSKEGIDSVTVIVDGITYTDDGGDTHELHATQVRQTSSGTVDIDLGEVSKIKDDIDGDDENEELRYGQDSNGNYLISNVYQLQSIDNGLGDADTEIDYNGLDDDYKLVSDIDASDTKNWNGDNGFVPIGRNSGEEFTGTLDGNGYKIDGLYINRDSTSNVGLVASTFSDAKFKDVVLTNVDIDGYEQVGGLVGENKGTVENSYSTGSVSGDRNVGGLIGEHRDGTISNSYSTGSISGEKYIGGLIGVSGGTVIDSYSTGSVDGTDVAGGLVGSNDGTVENSYSTGSVSGESNIGGLIGSHRGGTISNSYSTGSIEGTDQVGGLVAENKGTVTESYWDKESTGIPSSAGGTELTTSDMQGSSASTNMNFDFSSTWDTVSEDYPELSWEE